MIIKNFLVQYHQEVGDNKGKQSLRGFDTIEDAKKYILASQLVPNSFFSEHSELNRLTPHYLTIEDSESGKTVYGKEKETKITTLGVLSADQVHNIPDGHIFLFHGGEEAKSEYRISSGGDWDKDKEDIIFHIDKREFEQMVNTIFLAETGYEYSQLKAKKLKYIMESRFYNSMRYGLEMDLTERISEVVIMELGSIYTDDAMFEDTRRSLLPYFIEKFHREEVSKFSFINHESIEGLERAIEQLDLLCETVEGDPPKFFTKEWSTMMDASAKKMIDRAEEAGVTINPLHYTDAKLHEPEEKAEKKKAEAKENQNTSSPKR